MEMILQRYERCSYSSKELVATNVEAQENLIPEYYKLKSKVKALQRRQRHLMGEDIEALSIKELQILEQQLDTSLRQIRSRKERVLQNGNNSMRKKLKEKELTLSLSEQHIQMEQSSSVPRLETLPTLNLSGTSQPSGNEGGEEDGAIIRPRTTKSLIPPWMLGPTNP